jgi:hypothetical protein
LNTETHRQLANGLWGIRSPLRGLVVIDGDIVLLLAEVTA